MPCPHLVRGGSGFDRSFVLCISNTHDDTIGHKQYVDLFSDECGVKISVVYLFMYLLICRGETQ
jgi:hypothetical protein